ncbi:hypothetical protein FPO82_14750 (plasmid) [Staphylococcus aureus]|nr:hypothetical protein FPO82_14750 [Staphylococcus aureus]
MQHLPLNITYATWAGLGLVLTTVVSIIIFKEQINLITIVSIVFNHSRRSFVKHFRNIALIALFQLLY